MYRTRAINHRGHYSKKIFWPIGCGYYSREATIQKKILEVLHFIMLLKLVISHKEKNGLLRKYNIRILGGLDCWTSPDKHLGQDLVYKCLKILLKSSIFCCLF